MTDVFAAVANRHPNSTGPTVDWAKVERRSYFENHYGEQWVFWWEGGRLAFLSGGDMGWDVRAIDATLGAEAIQETLMGLAVTTHGEVFSQTSVLVNEEEAAWIKGFLMSIQSTLRGKAA